MENPLEVQLLCISEEFRDEFARTLAARRVDINTKAVWFLLVDQPSGWALKAHLELDPRRLIISTDNPCPEYRLDLQERYPAALTWLMPIDKLVIDINTVQKDEWIHSKPLTPLTPTERLTLQMVAEEKTNKEIANARGVSVKTVKNTLSIIYLKLGLESRLQAFHYYYGQWRWLCNWKPPSHVTSK